MKVIMKFFLISIISIIPFANAKDSMKCSNIDKWIVNPDTVEQFCYITAKCRFAKSDEKGWSSSGDGPPKTGGGGDDKGWSSSGDGPPSVTGGGSGGKSDGDDSGGWVGGGPDSPTAGWVSTTSITCDVKYCGDIFKCGRHPLLYSELNYGPSRPFKGPTNQTGGKSEGASQ